MKKGEKREVGFSYGLGRVDTTSGQLGLSVGGDFSPGGELTVVALVSTPQPGQKLTLKLPEGFSFADGQAAQQDVPPPGPGGRPGPITWRVRSSRLGIFPLEVNSNVGGISQRTRVKIKADVIF
jgi:hypothetical protein